MDRLTVRQLVDIAEEGSDYVLFDRPTGLYADRESYGNRPILAFVLGDELPCKAAAFPYSTKVSPKEEVDEVTGRRISSDVRNFVVDRAFIADNENLGVAAAFVDQAIRQGSPIEVHGRYIGGLLEVDFLKVGRLGFRFTNYQFPWVDGTR